MFESSDFRKNINKFLFPPVHLFYLDELVGFSKRKNKVVEFSPFLQTRGANDRLFVYDHLTITVFGD